MAHECAASAEITLQMIRESLHAAVICDSLDALGYRDQSPRIQLRPYTTDAILVGRCRTTLWRDGSAETSNPYELELAAVDSCRPDDVFVAAAGGSMISGIWGELLSTAARNAGCVGAVVDGAVRDVRKMRELGFPVFARGTSVYDSQNRQVMIDMDVPVQIGGVRFRPGDLVIADEDGVVVVPQEVEAEVLRRAWEKARSETAFRRAVGNGMKATTAYERHGVL
jgi:regulator of RNase E activity RraA